MKTKRRILWVLTMLMAVIANGCIGDLDQYPHIEKTSKDIYTSVHNYRQVLAKLYGSYVLSGQDKGGGNKDIEGTRGFDYMRCYFNLQEIGTDEVAMISYAADNQTGLSFLSWDANDVWVFDTYYRIYYTIALCNEFIRNASDESISDFTEEDQEQIRMMKAEARFLRALAYSHALDLFREVPFVDENSTIGNYFPPKYSALQIFDFITGELEEIAGQLPPHPEYPRAGAAAAYGLLARVYLNAEAYGCGNHYDDCADACLNVIDLGYKTLEPNFKRLFGASNDKCTDEILFAFAVDNNESVSWGASTYIVCAQTHKNCAYELGVQDQSWEMFRCRSQIPALYEDDDTRRLFYTDGRDPELEDFGDKEQGYFYMKWNNLYDDGTAPKTTDGVCTDLPIIRLADVYLMLAEAQLRGSARISSAEALEYVNKVRRRAFGDNGHDISAIDFTLDFIIQERARELSLEMVRRTDLVRFGLFTTDKYLWDYKGGAPVGRAVDNKYNVYPIPYAEQTANPNMKQDY